MLRPQRTNKSAAHGGLRIEEEYEVKTRAIRISTTSN